MRVWQIVLIAGLIGMVSMFYQGLWKNPKDIPTVLVGTEARGFSGTEVVSEELILLEDYKGKVVLINFWASWCLECKLEHQNLLAIQKRFSNEPKFVMLGINFQDRLGSARKYLETYGNNFQHVYDQKGTISVDYGVYGVPETFVLDQDGIIRFKHVGPIVGVVYPHVMDKVIIPLLEERSLSTL